MLGDNACQTTNVVCIPVTMTLSLALLSPAIVKNGKLKIVTFTCYMYTFTLPPWGTQWTVTIV